MVSHFISRSLTCPDEDAEGEAVDDDDEDDDAMEIESEDGA